MLDEEQAIEDHLRRFVADASHELRTPVTVIQGVVELWRDGALKDAGVISDALRRVGQESARMAALVEDLLLLARLDEGRPLGNDLVDLSQIAHEVLEGLSAIYHTHHVVDEIDDFVTATGDSIRLRQVLSNLVSNAMLHTPSGTHVRLSLKRDGEKSVIEVQDDGPGMDPEDATRLFERFWRGSPARRGPGSGLGLSIVAGIVAAHQGTVEMTTELGRGTKVRVILLAGPAPRLARRGFLTLSENLPDACAFGSVEPARSSGGAQLTERDCAGLPAESVIRNMTGPVWRQPGRG